MLAGIYSAASGMDAAALMHSVTAANLANVQSPGYMRRIQPMSFDGLSGNRGNTPMAKASATHLDMTSGPKRASGRPLDLAIDGDGFFVVDGPDGPLFTRSGSFHVDSAGRITNVDGLPVRGTNGNLTLPAGATTEEISVLRDGVVKVGQAELGKLELAQFDNPNQLTPMGVSLFAATPEAGRQQSEASILQGSVELSNVSPMTELVGLLAASRHYEASQQAMKMISSSTEKHVNS